MADPNGRPVVGPADAATVHALLQKALNPGVQTVYQPPAAPVAPQGAAPPGQLGANMAMGIQALTNRQAQIAAALKAQGE